MYFAFAYSGECVIISSSGARRFVPQYRTHILWMLENLHAWMDIE